MTYLLPNKPICVKSPMVNLSSNFQMPMNALGGCFVKESGFMKGGSKCADFLGVRVISVM